MITTLTSSIDQVKGASLGLALPECLTFGIHWLDLTLWPMEPDKLPENIRKVQYAVNSCLLGLDDQDPASLWERFDWGINCYRKHAQSAKGMRLYWDNCNDPTGLHLLIPGRALDEIFLADIERFYRQLLVDFHYVKCTRLDLAWDHCPFTVEQAGKATQDRAMLRSKAKDAHWYEKERLFGERKAKLEDGETVEIGSKSSQRMVRIYNGRGFVRLEMQLRQERAEHVFIGLMRHHDLLGRPIEPITLALGILRDYLDFVVMGEDSNVTRCPLLPWWESFVKNTAIIKQVIQRVAVSVERSKRWVEKSVTPTIAALLRCMGEDGFVDWFRNQVETAEGRLRAHHRRMILEALIAAGAKT